MRTCELYPFTPRLPMRTPPRPASTGPPNSATIVRFFPLPRVSSAIADLPASRINADTRPRGTALLVLLGILTAIASLSIDMYLPALPAIAADLRAAPGLLEATL